MGSPLGFAISRQERLGELESTPRISLKILCVDYLLYLLQKNKNCPLTLREAYYIIKIARLINEYAAVLELADRHV